MTTPTPTLVFVYNADSGPLNALLDFGHKIVSPSTYPCSLCALTYGTFGMRREWREFTRGLGVPLEFLHADELRERYGTQDAPLPAVFLKREGLEPLLTRPDLDRLGSLGELQTAVTQALTSAPLSESATSLQR